MFAKFVTNKESDCLLGDPSAFPAMKIGETVREVQSGKRLRAAKFTVGLPHAGDKEHPATDESAS